MTPIYGLTEDGLKGMGRDLRVLPKTLSTTRAVT